MSNVPNIPNHRGPYSRADYFDSNIFQAASLNYQGEWVANIEDGNVGFTVVFATDTIYAVPFISPPLGGKILGITATVRTLLAASTIRIGVYDNVADVRDAYPSTLLFDSGTISSATTGVKPAACELSIVPGEIYWLVLAVSSSVTLAIGSLPAQSALFLGCNPADFTTTGRYSHISVANAYAAFPTTYPAGGVYVSTQAPALRCQFG